MDVMNIDAEERDDEPTKISEVICLHCLKRWVAVRPDRTKLVDLECPGCGKQGGAIETGEDIEAPLTLWDSPPKNYVQ